MQTHIAEIDTPAAMLITGANGIIWRQAMSKNFYPGAPPPVSGNSRLWDVDSLLCLRWWDSLVKMGMLRPLAGQLAAELMKAVTSHPEITTFLVFVWEEPDGEKGHMAIGTVPPDEAPDARVTADLPVGRWRREIRAAIADHVRRRVASHAKRRR